MPYLRGDEPKWISDNTRRPEIREAGKLKKKATGFGRFGVYIGIPEPLLPIGGGSGVGAGVDGGGVGIAGAAAFLGAAFFAFFAFFAAFLGAFLAAFLTIFFFAAFFTAFFAFLAAFFAFLAIAQMIFSGFVF
jgi:hypothetical protein